MPHEKTTSLAARIVAIQAELDNVQKTGWNDYHKFHFATSDDVLSALRPLLAKHGVAVLYRGTEDVAITEAGTTRGGAVKYRTSGYVLYRIVNTDNPDDFLDIRHYAEAIDQEDKGANKLSTSGDKYVNFRLFRVVTGDPRDDVDSHAPSQDSAPHQVPDAPPEPEEDESELFGKKWASALLEKLDTKGISLSKLRARLYDMGYREALKGRTAEVHRWPKIIGPHISEAIEWIERGGDVPPAPPEEAKEVLALINLMWKDCASLSPSAPKKPEELLQRMLENYDDYPGETIEARCKVMIDALKVGDVLFESGVRIPF